MQINKPMIGIVQRYAAALGADWSTFHPITFLAEKEALVINVGDAIDQGIVTGAGAFDCLINCGL